MVHHPKCVIRLLYQTSTARSCGKSPEHNCCGCNMQYLLVCNARERRHRWSPTQRFLCCNPPALFFRRERCKGCMTNKVLAALYCMEMEDRQGGVMQDQTMFHRRCEMLEKKLLDAQQFLSFQMLSNLHPRSIGLRN